MPLSKRNRHLLQTDEHGNRHLYIWTPTLAQRPDMRLVSFEQAEQIEKELKEEAERKRFMHDQGMIFPDQPEEPLPDEPEAVTEVSDTMHDPEVKAKAMELVIDNQMLLEKELKHVSGLETGAEIESYMLEKYKIDMGDQDFDRDSALKEASAQLLGLSNSNKLFEVHDGK